MLEKSLVVDWTYEESRPMMADWIRVMKILVQVYAALKAMIQEVYGGLRLYICTVYMYLSCVWSSLLISSLTQVN